MPISDLSAVQQEMSFPDWRKRLERARRESARGKGNALDEYLRERKRRGS